MRKHFSFFLPAFLALIHPAQGRPLIALDAGHDPDKPGALSVCGKQEIAYNDEIVRILQQSLTDYMLVLTREFQAPVKTEDATLIEALPQTSQAKWPTAKTLLARAALANQRGADLFISIHHDSTNDDQQVFDPSLCGGKGGKRIKDDYKKKYSFGYSILMNDEDPARRDSSRKFADLVAKKLRGIGRKPSTYHGSPEDGCKSCRVLDAELGIFHADLAVLRNTKMPAILIEVGTIIDVEDEKLVSESGFRQNFAAAVKEALKEYFASTTQAQKSLGGKSKKKAKNG